MNNSAVANLIWTGETAQIPSVIQTGVQHGMKTMTQSLEDLAAQGLIDPTFALDRARHDESGEVI